MDNNQKNIHSSSYDVIIPTDEKNAKFVGTVIKYIRKNLHEAECIYIISNKKLFKTIARNTQDKNYLLLDENELISGLSFTQVRSYLLSAGHNSINGVGWYFQQLLKLAFAQTPYCKEYYLSWDSDTIPLSNINFFIENKPLFTLKKEYHQPYFDTIERLLGLKKVIKKSFIAEHMIFKKEYVLEMLEKISKSNIKGKYWYEKIIYSCDFTIKEGSFSEFETYGTYCVTHHPEKYGFQQLNTFRGGAMIRGRYINDKIISKLSIDLDIVSFELRDSLFPFNLEYKIDKMKRGIKKIKSILGIK